MDSIGMFVDSTLEAAMKIRKAAPFVNFQMECKDANAAGWVSRWIEVKLDAAVIDKLLHMEWVRTSHGFAMVADRIPVTYGSAARDPSPVMLDGKVVIEAFGDVGMFHFEAREKYTGGVGRTNDLVIADFFSKVVARYQHFTFPGADFEGFKEMVESDLAEMSRAAAA